MMLFCLPYAGGSEVIYYKWNDYLSPAINLCPVLLKGRGRRFDEPFYNNLEEAVDDIFDAIRDKIGERDYAIYGHSMGSLLAYELYYKIIEMGVKKPKHIFFSGYKAPSEGGKKEITYNLPNNDFKNKVIDLGGTPEEIIHNDELFEFFIPLLKHDFKIVETYEYKDKRDKIACDISVLNGKEDAISLKGIIGWQNHTSGNFKIYNFEGNHFFINNNVEKIVTIINDTLAEVLN
ncbi:thioesterase II family protein [Bacillus thuringiensis]